MARPLRFATLGVAAAALSVGASLLAEARAPQGEAPAKEGAASVVRRGDFALRILPILTRAGCNSGQCHGAAGGQGGFSLSLRGYDPEADYDAIVRERAGRRVDLDEPDRSLVLRKPSLEIPHKGGRRLREGDPARAEIEGWIAAGAPRGTLESGVKVVELDVQPPAFLGRRGETLTLRVGAKLSDGWLVDVTDLALTSSNDESVARVSDARVEIVGPGETAILVRFASKVGFARVGAPFGEPIPWIGEAVGIDALVERKLAAMGIAKSGPCDDATFHRRVTLDLTGRVPAADEARRFLADPSPDKRRTLVDRLLSSDACAARWARWLADLCRVREETMGTGAAHLHAYLRDAVAARVPLDALVRSLVASTGELRGAGPAAFNLATPGPMEQMEFVTRTFLGYRLQCAQCHQHPFDRWSRQDYFGAAAFFARARRDGGRLVLAGFGEFNDPKTGKPALPRFPGGGTAEVAAGVDRRAVFCDWMLDRDARRFDRALVNRLWREFFGRGLVEPVDDLRDSNPASNPELLDEVARLFAEGGRDLLFLVRTIVSTRVYERSREAEPGAERDERYGSHALVRPLTAVALLDSVLTVTGAALAAPRAPAVARAVDLPDADGGHATLQAFGRCPRDGSIDPSQAPQATLPMALHWIQGSVANEWLAVPGGPVDRLVAARATPEAAVEELFFTTLGRPPRADELRTALQVLEGPSLRAALEDLLWALLATTEFSTNH